MKIKSQLILNYLPAANSKFDTCNLSSVYFLSITAAYTKLLSCFHKNRMILSNHVQHILKYILFIFSRSKKLLIIFFKKMLYCLVLWRKYVFLDECIWALLLYVGIVSTSIRIDNFTIMKFFFHFIRYLSYRSFDIESLNMILITV